MSWPPRVLPMGQDAILLECSSVEEVMALQALLREGTHEGSRPGVQEVVAAARTVLVRCDSPTALKLLKQRVLAVKPTKHVPVTGIIHTLDTVYDGADLQDVARLNGMGPEGLLAWHTGQDWKAAFGGFAPGFMYLTPTDRALAVPRRATPRTAVPAGSVAVAGEFSAVYPGPTPGGWQLLGHCANQLWDAGRAEPALIQPGDTVRFAAVRELITLATPAVSADSATLSATAHLADAAAPWGPAHGLRVLSAGTQTTVQDLGRAGFAHLGVTGSGALDRAALRRVNRMVGNNTVPANPANAAGAAGLETVLAGLALKAAGTHIVAVTGGPVTLGIEDPAGGWRCVPRDTPFVLRDGEILNLFHAPETGGFRSYLGVRGGLGLPRILGSCATDVLSGLGPAPLQPGMFLPVLPAPCGSIVGFPEAAPSPQEPTVLRYLTGPRQEWFTQQSLDIFERQEWCVGAQSNRIGLRLEGTPLLRAGADTGTQAAGQLAAGDATAELPSEGMVEGALQVPPSGLPVLFLADHPVTGGYPVLGVVLAEDLDTAAQLAPGARVRFHKVTTSS